MNTQEVVLETPLGSLRGLQQDGLLVFHGVPYAMPPVGARRFAPPALAQPWAGERDARHRGAIAPQTPSRLAVATGDFEEPQDEDCLTLTVWTQGVDAARRPVLVWFHGGAYTSGAGSLPWYDGSRLASEGDIVVVNVTSRLGALGYLYAPGVSPGNLGLLDQVAALEWVKSHIAAFGGDPLQVTVMGQSAGAHAIALMLARPNAEAPLAQRAILQSAPLGVTLYDLDKAKGNGDFFLRALGIDPDDPRARELACQASIKQILDAQTATTLHVVQQSSPGEPGALPFIPIADGVVLPTPGHMASALKGAAGKLDVLIGTTRDEATCFFYGNPAIEALTRAPIPEEDAARLAARRPGGSAGRLLMDFVCEQVFLWPSLDWARRAAQAGRNTYLYQFDWAAANRDLAATHCLELPFVFGTREAFAAAPMMAGADTGRVDALSAAMRASWISFIRTGNPNHAGVPPWPPFEPARRATMRFDDVTGAVGDLAGDSWRAAPTT
ncbi:carboxylesterase/lipase family protein [Pseudomonas canadensis]|uniref:Carboxylic ester hydrolase n=1 Tax=Pseudomonas canadensis TaxID=915099 RepID=A0ABZ1A0I3_9PSED|nr:carboxylesterase family protein [Pseudomonas canadensis]WRI21844.1 carboxylesterase family protein [Pseudomonas canadensis]